NDYPWWQQGVVYQIYPRSFQDTNGDGVGDLPGIIQRLDYVRSLNVDAIWISPIYPSPMHDFGYDVADYTAVHPLFGTLDDFDRLLQGAHQRGLKVLLDLVPNHTSSEHPWFVESRASRDNPRHDWYIWADPKPDGGPPNNWLSCFGGPAWEFDEGRRQYYLHQFEVRQPELNYQNPAVLEAMLNVMRFWLDRGVDGFRVDVIEMLAKHPDLPDEPENPHWNGVEPYQRLLHPYTRNRPEVHDIIRAMRRTVDEYDQRVLIGEIFIFDEGIGAYYGDNDECHLPFNFRLIYLPGWRADRVRQAVDGYDACLPAGCWPNWVLGNHDQHRVATRIGKAQARVAAMLLLTLRGTPTVYYGEEIGMENVHIPPDRIKDPPALNQPEIAHIFGRDPERTPMQWNDSPHAGFTDPGVEPWLPVAGNYAGHNVVTEANDPASMLSLFRALTALRRAEPALSVGDYVAVSTGADHEVFAYLRFTPGCDAFLIVLNFGDNALTLDLSEVAATARVAVATDMARMGRSELAALALNPHEGLVLRLGAYQ
ncbi:MAG: alpha-amylase family glycosyl hydrolase, partial [Pseudomonadota bacterium]|nr:alpha-amylase family glycosyl hydrolase [Pseudomonadota bacterium]